MHAVQMRFGVVLSAHLVFGQLSPDFGCGFRVQLVDFADDTIDTIFGEQHSRITPKIVQLAVDGSCTEESRGTGEVVVHRMVGSAPERAVNEQTIHAVIASAAKVPLRTAPSIVAGQPVAVQSPARNKPGTGVRCGG